MSTPTSARALDDAWLAWAVAADDADELARASALYESLPDGLDSPDVAVARARLLLLRGRPLDALTELAAHGWHEMPPSGPRTWPEVVLVAARAATGDARSFQSLLEAASRSMGSPGGWRIAYLVAAAAEQSGQTPIADQAWTTLTLTYAVVTPLTVQHLAVAEVARRDPHDFEATCRVIATQAGNLSGLAPGPTSDPGPLLAAAAGLRARGDDAGARLLLHAVARQHPRIEQIDAALLEVTPEPEMRRHRSVAVALGVCAVLLAVPLGIVGAAAAFGARTLWCRSVRIPGLGLADSRTWRAIGTLHYDQASGDVVSGESSTSGWYGVVGIVGCALGAFVGYAASAAATAALGRDVVAVSTSMWLLGLVGVPVIAIVLARRLHLRMLASRRRRREATRERQRLAEAAQCQCWTSAWFRGQRAEDYQDAHLQPVLDPTVLTELARRLAEKAQVARCPVTGVVWLSSPVGRAGTPMLLRGVVPTAPAPQDAPTGYYL